MLFDKDSGLVKIWASLVMAGTYSLDQVPTLYNFKTVVSEVINETSA